MRPLTICKINMPDASEIDLNVFKMPDAPGWLAGCIISNVVQLPQREGRMHARGYNMTEIHTI
jgi:hypothetical protein